ncbi:glycosyltransferase family 2 protein [Desulfomicrobium escambiense]|uniref:glycosyltransferase family 2 protein n=1 Tax=Desulfomicrobium escambiense TaxID=29503 RepID=UPI0009FE9B5A|nr:glycosyltransferase family 2 protein [Desulfomicrobium escambiense]
MNSKISIVIPTWNNSNLLRQCIKSILSNTVNNKFEIIVVDNGSTDNTKNKISEFQSLHEIHYIFSKKNLGFAKACNLGALQANNKFIFFLNNDTEVLQGWDIELLKCLRADDRIGIAGGKLIYPDKTIQHAGIAFDQQTVFHVYRHFHPIHPGVNKKREFQAVTGACFLIRKELFLSAGMFDESFINGFEDLDLCFRIRKNGYKVFYTPGSNVIHHESKTPGRHLHHHENAELFSKRWRHDVVNDINLIYAKDGLYPLEPGENIPQGNWLKDTNPNPLWSMAQSFRKSGKTRESIIAFNEALRFNPYDLRKLKIIEEIGDLHLDQNNLQAAKNCFLAITSAIPVPRLSSKINKINELLSKNVVN